MMMRTLNTLNVADLSASAPYEPQQHFVPDNSGSEMPHQYQQYQQQQQQGFATHVTSRATPPAMPVVTAPIAPAFVASPSKNPCMVRVHGVQGDRNSRYRNDPYTYSVFPSVAASRQQQPNSHHVQATTQQGLATRRLAPLPPALHMASTGNVIATGSATNRRGAGNSRLKAEITRAQEFAHDAGIQSSPESSVASHQQFQNQRNQLMQHVTAGGLETLSSEMNTSDDSLDIASSDMSPQPGQTLDTAQWAMVRLKYEALLYNVRFPVKEGDFVVLEGDRGENVGRVINLVYTVPQHPVQCHILRVADDTDIEAVRVQREKEEAAKHFAQGVSDALQLGIRVVDTEFQTDGNKLTIYFTSRRQIDFRRLQRQMFKQYRCRIWLVNWTDVIKAE